MEITDRLLDVLHYQLKPEGLTVQQPNADHAITVLRSEQPLAYIQNDGLVLYSIEAKQEISKRITPIVSQVWKMERAYQEASSMDIDAISEYRKLLDYNGCVLAARYDGEGEFTFANWLYSHDKKDVSLGHYFHQNAYSQAKEDFLIRSGLVERSEPFYLDELSVVREALLFRRLQDTELSTEDRQELDRVLHRVESDLLYIDDQLLEAEAEIEHER